MTLDDLLTRNNINLSDKAREFCNRGLQLMHEAVDPVHNVGHIERIYADCHRFIAKNRDVKLNFEVLIISITWHDVWRAMHFDPNPFYVIYAHWVEGKNAARLTAASMTVAGFDHDVIAQVSYCILKHPDPQFSRRKTIESKVLHDLDQLDSWNNKRLREFTKYMESGRKGRLVLRILRHWQSRLLNMANHTYYFMSSQKERDRRFPLFKKQVAKLFK